MTKISSLNDCGMKLCWTLEGCRVCVEETRKINISASIKTLILHVHLKCCDVLSLLAFDYRFGVAAVVACCCFCFMVPLLVCFVVVSLFCCC